MPISNEENRRFEELIGTLEPIKANPESKKVEKRYRMVVVYSILALICLIALIVSVSIQQPIVGVASFAVMLFAANKITNEFFESGK